jgi:hypothetical protein
MKPLFSPVEAIHPYRQNKNIISVLAKRLTIGIRSQDPAEIRAVSINAKHSFELAIPKY